jgi:hypothetical protein
VGDGYNAWRVAEGAKGALSKGDLVQSGAWVSLIIALAKSRFRDRAQS